MSSGSDGLIDHLLFYIALSGTQGLNTADFVKSVVEFHGDQVAADDHSSASENEDLFLSTKPPKKRIVLDSDYLDSVWSWLCNHKDVTPTTSTLISASDTSNFPRQQRGFLDKHASTRLATTEDRIWHAIADHGKDWKRLPKSEFQCLCVIAAHGRGGVLQPDVVHITGQDKRSVPGRTDKLAEKGYITKEPVLGGGSKTSFLRLKKFSTIVNKSGTTFAASNNARVRNSDNTAYVIRYDEWFDAIYSTLSRGNGLATTEAIRKAAGVESRPHVRSLMRCLKRLETTGMVRRVSAKVELKYPKKGKKSRESWIRSVKLLREPTQRDRDVFMADMKRTSAYMQPSSNTRAGSDDENDSDLDLDEDDNADVNDGLLDDEDLILRDIEDDAGKRGEGRGSTTSYWTPDVHYSNLMYDVIGAAGMDGISSMDLSKALSTSLYRRPFDDAIGRITDEWQIAQPPHLRHLAIVRDTHIQGSVTHYTFRTMLNYQKSVEEGLASWDYLAPDPALRKALLAKPDLDEWGFARIPKKEFLDTRLPATACAKAVQVKPPAQTAEARQALASLEATSAHDGKIAPSNTPAPAPRQSQTDPKPLGEQNSLIIDMPSPSPLEYDITTTTPRPRKKSRLADIDAFSMQAPSTVNLEKRAVWTKRYHEALATWRGRMRSRAKMSILAEEIRKQELHEQMLAQIPPPPPRKRGRPRVPVQIDEHARVEGIPDDWQSILSPSMTSEGQKLVDVAGTKNTTVTTSNETNGSAASVPAAQLQSLKRSKKRKRPPTYDELNVTTERLQSVTDRLATMKEPGVYMHEPRATMIHRDESTHRGRPRNGMIAVFKSEKLKQLDWFHEEGPLQPSNRLRLWVPDMFAGPDLAQLDSDHLPDITPVKPKKARKPYTRTKPARRPTEGEDQSNTPLDGSHEDQNIEELQQNNNATTKDIAPLTPERRRTDPSAAEPAASGTDDIMTASSRDNTTWGPEVEMAGVPVANMGNHLSAIDQSREQQLPPVHRQLVAAVSPPEEDAILSRTIAKVGVDQAPAQQIEVPQDVAVETATAPISESRADLPTQYAQDRPLQTDDNGLNLDRGCIQGTDDSADRQSQQESEARTSPQQLAGDEDQVMQDHTTPVGDDEWSPRPTPGPTPDHQATLPFSAGMNMWEKVTELEKTNRSGRGPRLQPARKGVNRTSGQVEYQRAKIILDVIRECGGAFPGRAELFFPFATVWKDRFNQLPDRKTLDRSLNGLLRSKRLKKIPFSFTVKDEEIIIRNILAEPQIGNDSNLVKNLMKEVEAAHPHAYFPIQANVSTTMRYRIRQRRKTAPGSTGIFPQLPSFFTRDDTVVLQPSQVPRLGRLEEELRATAEARQKKRELDAQQLAESQAWRQLRPRVQRRNVEERAEKDGSPDASADELGPEILERTTAFQLTNYEYQPEAAHLDRGPTGRGRLSKVMRFKPTLQEMRHRMLLTDLPSLRQRKAVRQPRQSIQIEPSLRETTPMDGSLMFVNSGVEDYHEPSAIRTALTLMDPLVMFHSLTGTFSTNQSRILLHNELFWTSAPSDADNDIQQARFDLSLADIVANTAKFDERVFVPEYSDEEGAAFDEEIARVELWEKSMRTKRGEESVMGIPTTGFINHFAPKVHQAAPVDERMDGDGLPKRRPPLSRSIRPIPSYPGPKVPTGSSGGHFGILKPDKSRPWEPSLAPWPAGMYPPAQRPSLGFVPEQLGERTRKVRRAGGSLLRSEGQSWRQRLHDTFVESGMQVHPKPRSIKQLTGDRLRTDTTPLPMTAKEEERLMYAVAVVTTLMGGLQQTNRCTNYAAVNHAMHFKFDGAYCRQHYGLIKPKHGLFVEQIQQRFRVIFLHAFERDEIPAHIDLATVENTDWIRLVDWAQSKLSKHPNQTSELPETREEFDEQFDVELWAKYEPSKDDFFQHLTSTVRKDDMINSYAYFDPLPDVKHLQTKRGPSMLLQSWIRANVLTPEDAYDRKAANVKLRALGDAPLQSALDSMLGQKLIRGATKPKTTPGRNFVIDVPLTSAYMLPWQWTSTLFSGAVAFKDVLDAEFGQDKAEHQRHMVLREDISNAQTMVMLNLTDANKLAISVDLPPTDPGFELPYPKITKWGFTEGNYKSMSMDKSRLMFPMSIRPTSNYIYNERSFPSEPIDLDTAFPLPPSTPDRILNTLHPRPLLHHPIHILPVPLTIRYASDERTPRDTPHRLPYWTDIHGRLMKNQLRQVVLVALYLLLGRPGLSGREMSRTLGGKVWGWEMGVLCDWLGRVGVLECDDDTHEEEGDVEMVSAEDGEARELVGWRLSEWWWLAGEAVEAQEGRDDGDKVRGKGKGKARRVSKS
ncbi:B-block-binding subunit of TFIIIC domain-containing protein [Elsinoe fawcettii]|nr:B-block-binding subunit of TFIIIC domain-containing protein [Elsinoe fawcettii]